MMSPSRRRGHLLRWAREGARSRVGVGSRKGVMYTVVAIFILIAISSIFMTQIRRPPHEQFTVVESRVRTMDAFLDDLEQDSARAAYIAGFRSLIAMEQHVTTSGEYIADPSAAFIELFVNGTYQNGSFTIMRNATFEEYLSRVRAQARRQGIDCNLTVVHVSLWQRQPWSIMVNYTLNISIADAGGVASWGVQRTMLGEVPVTDIRDPLYTGNTFARIQRVIKPTNITVFVDDAGDRNDSAGLRDHFNRSSYVAAGRGPDILMRFANNNSDSIYGIESLVDVDELAAQGLPVDPDATVVDYKYFSNIPATACDVQTLPERISFVADDLVVYGVEGGLSYESC